MGITMVPQVVGYGYVQGQGQQQTFGQGMSYGPPMGFGQQQASGGGFIEHIHHHHGHGQPLANVAANQVGGMASNMVTQGTSTGVGMTQGATNAGMGFGQTMT